MFDNFLFISLSPHSTSLGLTFLGQRSFLQIFTFLCRLQSLQIWKTLKIVHSYTYIYYIYKWSTGCSLCYSKFSFTNPFTLFFDPKNTKKVKVWKESVDECWRKNAKSSFDSFVMHWWKQKQPRLPGFPFL